MFPKGQTILIGVADFDQQGMKFGYSSLPRMQKYYAKHFLTIGIGEWGTSKYCTCNGENHFCRSQKKEESKFAELPRMKNDPLVHRIYKELVCLNEKE